MVRFLLAGVLLAGVTAASFAADGSFGAAYKKWRLSLSGGYATVNMTGVNNDFSAAVDSFGSGSVTKITNGWLGAGELLYRVHPRLWLGPRVEYLQTNQGKLVVPGATETEDLSILPVMAGVRYGIKQMSEEAGASFCDNCGLNIGVFAGWATAWGQLNPGQVIKYSGSGFAGEVLFGWEHRVGGNWMLAVDVGYRCAPVSEMKTTQDYPLLGASKGAVLVDINGDTLKYDYSGLIASAGIGLRF
ncbi:MAG: hypothetical protein ACYC5N_05320 [Endomicrobiales bacterium]